MELLDYCTLAAPGSPEPRLVVTHVRRYGDGRYVYGVADPDGGDDHGCLYDADQLRLVGGRCDLAYFEIPGPFKHRDVVVVAADCQDAEYRSLEGVVDGWQDDGFLSVRFDDLGECAFLPPSDLVATGRKAALPVPDGDVTSSVLVSGDGEVLRRDDYVIVDDLDFRL